MIRVIDVADHAGLGVSLDHRTAHQPVANDGAAHPSGAAKRAEVPAGETNRGFALVRRRLGDQVDGTAEAVAAVERALRAAKDLDPLEVEKVGQHHRRPRQVDAVQIHGGTRIGPREHRIGADPADRDLRQSGVL